MKTIEQIVVLLEERGESSGSEIAAALGLSRQAVNRHLRQLVEQGKAAKSGNTRGASYALIDSETAHPPVRRQFESSYSTSGLEEDYVYSELSLFLSLDRNLSAPAGRIFQYALTEIVNNAIDHSDAPKCRVAATVDAYLASFEVTDGGIGIFASIAHKFRLENEVQAVVELSKGKRTTKPDRHAGEGIYFTSKCADRLTITSHATRLIYDNTKNDIYVEKVPRRKGTSVGFEISRRSRRDLHAVFSEYAPDDYDFRFERTRVRVKLVNERYASRSEAKRLLAGLEQFREVILDFKGVAGIGQGFADEIFRLFPAAHPTSRIAVENANEVVRQMISHARADSDA